MDEGINKGYRILVNDTLVPQAYTDALCAGLATVDYHEADYRFLADNIARYHAYYASAHVRSDRAILERAENLKIIATASTGTDHIDVAYAKSSGIQVLDLAREYELLDSFSATAELGWCLLLSVMRHVPESIAAARKGIWARQKYTGTQLLGKTIGILGYGRLGRMTARMAMGFRMNVLACDIKKVNEPGIEQVDFATLLCRSDIISIHVHLNDDTRNMISEKQIKKMKKGVILINTSRGAILDEKAVLAGLESGQIGGAGLDVIHGEWDEDLFCHPLIKYSREHENLIITPHIGGSTTESVEGAREFMAKKMVQALKSL